MDHLDQLHVKHCLDFSQDYAARSVQSSLLIFQLCQSSSKALRDTISSASILDWRHGAHKSRFIEHSILQTRI